MSSMHTIWMTGLSKSGKTVLAQAASSFIKSKGIRVEILDGKIIRDELGDYFGYSREERIKVSRILSVMARRLSKHGIVPVVTSITPYEESRDFNRRELNPYVEIYVDCPVEVCVTRDELGLYRKALCGDLKNFIGVDDPYEIPKKYDLRILTAQETLEESVDKLNNFVSQVMRLDITG